MDHIFVIGEKVIAKFNPGTGYFIQGNNSEISIEGTIQVIDMRAKKVLINDIHGSSFVVDIDRIEPTDWRRRYL